MYDSVSLPVHDETTTTSSLYNSHRASLEETLSRHKGKAALAALFVVAVVFVGVANTRTDAQQQSTFAYLEAQGDKIAHGNHTALTKFAIQGVDSQAYITHSSNTWEINSNIGIFGVSAFTTEEQWDFYDFNDTYGEYYKMVHSHDDQHWLTMQGASEYNPSVLHSPKTIYDREGFIRWDIVSNADGSGAVTGTPATGAGNIYYIVNKLRSRCLAIITAVTNPREATWDELQNSVTSFAKDASGNYPDSCKVQFIDATNAPEPPNGDHPHSHEKNNNFRGQKKFEADEAWW